MDNNELISIVVPIYNVEKYLKQCIESLLSQTYKNLEILLIDDGSTDKCPQICDEYEKKDKRIKVIHKKNGGLSDARNRGIEEAKGKYITFIDSDDYISENFVKKMYDSIIENNAEISQCNLVKVNDNAEVLQKIGYSDKSKFKTKYEIIKDLYTGHWENTIACNKLYKIELFENIRFPLGKLHEDEFTTYKVLYKATKVAMVEEYLYKYRQNVNSITGEQFKVKRLDAIEAFEERLDFFKEKGEIELYEVSFIAYLVLIRDLYIKTRKHIEKSKKIKKDLIKKYKEDYPKLKNIKNIGKMKRIKLMIFYFSPTLYYMIKS